MKDNKKYNKKDHSCFYCQSNDNLIEHREEDKDFICQSCLDKLDHSFKNIISINSIID